MSNLSSGSVKAPTRIPNVITRALSWGYGIGIGVQNRRFDRGVGVTTLDCPVISIGNLSAGGTGKTPMVHWVAKQVQAMGQSPAIAMRGYKSLPGEMGDEEREHRQALPGVPIVAQPDRIAGLRALFTTEASVDCVILDDGFQHRKIARDLDVVLIDASSPPYGDALLPRGFLRDPATSLARADSIVITHREMVSETQLNVLVRWIGSEVPECAIAIASHMWGSVSIFSALNDGWETENHAIGAVQGERVLGVCAIGNPDGFFAQIEAARWELVDRIELRDHNEFELDVIERICQRAKDCEATVVCMTRKDWVKVEGRLPASCAFRVVVPGLKVEFESGEEALRTLIRTRCGD